MKYLFTISLYLVVFISCHNYDHSKSSNDVKWKLVSVENTGSTYNLENILLLNTINKAQTIVTISEDKIQFYQNDTLIETQKIKISGKKIFFLSEGGKSKEGKINQSNDKLSITINDYIYKLTKN
jgi:hypothetical protein